MVLVAATHQRLGGVCRIVIVVVIVNSSFTITTDRSAAGGRTVLQVCPEGKKYLGVVVVDLERTFL